MLAAIFGKLCGSYMDFFKKKKKIKKKDIVTPFISYYAGRFYEKTALLSLFTH